MLVSSLVVALVLGLVQLALALWVRTALIDAAGEGARYAALAGGDLTAGEVRAADVAEMSFGPGYLTQATARLEHAAGYDVVVVELTAALPVLGLWGPAETLTVTGRAVQER